MQALDLTLMHLYNALWSISKTYIKILHSNVNKLVLHTNLVLQGLFQIVMIEVASKHLKVGREDTL